MPQIKTPITTLLNISVPIILAPLGFAGRGELASVVSRAGGFGFIGAEFMSSHDLKQNLNLARRKLDLKENDPVPIGVGLIGWILDITEASDDPRLISILEEKPAAIWFAFGKSDLGKYIAQTREYDAKREHKTLVFVMVHSVEDALRAANEWKADVIVVQGALLRGPLSNFARSYAVRLDTGIEAGGHGGSEAPPLLTLLQAVIREIPSGPPIVATGGISTGQQIAALLIAGADGVALGTRLMFTHESVYTPEQKEALQKAGLTDSTVRTLAFDEVGRTNGWPPKHDGRALKNNIIQDVEDGLSFEERLRKFDEGKEAGDTSRLIVWAGAGVGLTSSISSAEDVMRELENETINALKRAPSMLE
ncbi:inosine monophosphate dehydrogenase [Marasmius fiardii PR-910]|nr:inosine monophosphate dehydrogenase [Marasmius fiardii PR-910]